MLRQSRSGSEPPCPARVAASSPRLLFLQCDRSPILPSIPAQPRILWSAAVLFTLFIPSLEGSHEGPSLLRRAPFSRPENRSMQKPPRLTPPPLRCTGAACLPAEGGLRRASPRAHSEPRRVRGAALRSYFRLSRNFAA